MISSKCKYLFILITINIIVYTKSCASRKAGSSLNHQNKIKLNANSKESSQITCKDENGNSVDWFVAYKLPKVKNAPELTFKNGSGYSYILPKYNTWRPSHKSIGSLSSIVGNTITPIIKQDKDLIYMTYNDQPPYRDDYGTNGHSKGILIGNARGGLWLMHSVPKFPQRGENFYPSNGLVNAQMFLCLSLSTSKELDDLGNTFKLTRPHVMEAVIPDSLKHLFPNLKSFLDIKKFSSKGTQHNIFPIRAGQLEGKVYAKSPKYDKEIYIEWLAPTLKTNLDVQSWLSGKNAFESNCSNKFSHKVYNIAEKEIDGNNFRGNDHSKWAVGSEKKSPWVCVSDLNRMEGQKSRGGAVVCIHNAEIYSAFKSSVIDLSPCKRSKNDNDSGYIV